MESVLRSMAMYAILMVVFRLSGKRTLAQITTFDFVLLLIIGEATQQALLGDDFSLANATLVIVTLLVIDIGLSLAKERWPFMDKLLDGVPLIIVEDGKLHRDRMRHSRVDENDILTAARETQGLERLDQIKYAVLERNGGISIIPKAE
ncbi:MAG TPA: YetF domain-containing protein [Herpetosiphonaceae bacterium]|nr:YetF domain-containing protein [Herpetosiphonaceae bacterium]